MTTILIRSETNRNQLFNPQPGLTRLFRDQVIAQGYNPSGQKPRSHASTDHNSHNLDITWLYICIYDVLIPRRSQGGVSDGCSHGSMSGHGPLSV